jgi:hypothetical protein
MEIEEYRELATIVESLKAMHDVCIDQTDNENYDFDLFESYDQEIGFAEGLLRAYNKLTDYLLKVKVD